MLISITISLINTDAPMHLYIKRDEGDRKFAYRTGGGSNRGFLMGAADLITQDLSGGKARSLTRLPAQFLNLSS